MNKNKFKDLILFILVLCVGFQMVQIKSFDRRINMLLEQMSTVENSVASFAEFGKSVSFGSGDGVMYPDL